MTVGGGKSSAVRRQFGQDYINPLALQSKSFVKICV